MKKTLKNQPVETFYKAPTSVYAEVLPMIATTARHQKQTSNPCGPVDSVTSSAFFFPFFFPPPEQHWHETNIMKYHETTCNIFWEPIRRSESGFDFKGIVSSCWFLYFDVICHQTHFIDGLVVLFLWKRFSRIEAFRNGVISKCLKWTLAFHKWKNMDICVISIFRILDGVAFHKKQHFLILCYT